MTTPFQDLLLNYLNRLDTRGIPSDEDATLFIEELYRNHSYTNPVPAAVISARNDFKLQLLKRILPPWMMENEEVKEMFNRVASKYSEKEKLENAKNFSPREKWLKEQVAKAYQILRNRESVIEAQKEHIENLKQKVDFFQQIVHKSRQ